MRLELGSSERLHIRKETIRVTKSDVSYKIFYASDLHFLGEGSRPIVDQLIDALTQTKPHIILLGGDLIDSPWGLSVLREFVRQAGRYAPVWAIRGNHDVVVPKKDLRGTIEEVGGNWLEGQSIRIFDKFGMNIKIDGTLQKTSPLLESHDFPILCAHNPVVFPLAANLYYSLVLAGHLHGCQCVLWQKDQLLFPGAWFYKWNGLRFQQNRTTMLVSRGVSDTLPIRWNCPREVILCELY